jgi:cell division protein FtsL
MARAATAAARTSARPQRAPSRPQQRPARRRSGPARNPRAANARNARFAGAAAGARILPLPQRLELPALGPAAAGLLDRLLRGRVWVFLIGTLLVGIVFFNVDVLRLNRTIATTTEKATTLKQENARLVLEQARLASSERIQTEAARIGMVLPAPGDVGYLKSHLTRDARHAAQRMVPPNPVPPPEATSQTEQTPGTAPAASGVTQTTTTTPGSGVQDPGSGAQAPTGATAPSTTTQQPTTTTQPQSTASPTPDTPDPTPPSSGTTGGVTAGGP